MKISRNCGLNGLLKVRFSNKKAQNLKLKYLAHVQIHREKALRLAYNATPILYNLTVIHVL